MRIAIVDDDPEARAYLEDVLRNMGHICVQFGNGREIVTALARDTFDLLFLDWNMPLMEGIEVVEWARQNVEPCPPIILLTSRSDEQDVIRGLLAGADDFIIKPESPSIIAARVAALLRRSNPVASADRVEQHGAYAFDLLAKSVSFENKEVTLTTKEFELALLFFQNSNRAMSRSYILETVWDFVADLPTRTLDVHVSRIRTKLMLNPQHGFRLQTVFGFGYRLESYEGEE
jgi:DNA-binding response OmpR family regulator